MRSAWQNYSGKAALIHAGEWDSGLDAPGIQQARRLIEETDGEVTIYGYPGTQHAVFNDERPEIFDAAAVGLSLD
ncbi:MAG TPA: hypothetical protein VLW50_01690 [Streptosporangiaceae bacterium]|nr:hypothetical protein [Streptosporangiaceae bacterium]